VSRINVFGVGSPLVLGVIQLVVNDPLFNLFLTALNVDFLLQQYDLPLLHDAHFGHGRLLSDEMEDIRGVEEDWFTLGYVWVAGQLDHPNVTLTEIF
jgi:hypothetical protein